MFRGCFIGMILATSVLAEVPKCKGNAKVVDACFVIHGRATNGPGTPSLRNLAGRNKTDAWRHGRASRR